MGLLIFYLIPIVFTLLWLVFVKYCYKLLVNFNEEELKFPIVLYILMGLILLIPLLNYILGIGIWILSFNLAKDKVFKEFLSLLSGESEQKIIFSTSSKFFKKY